VAGVGAFVVGAFALFAVGIFMIGSRQMAFSDRFIVYTEFAKVTGLQPGAVIRVSGARAGTVRQILTPADPSGHFRVRLEIVDEFRSLVRTDSIASIESEGLVGGSYLSVGIGSSGAPEAPPESTIPSREPFEIADLMAQMQETVQTVNDSVTELTAEAQVALTSVVTALDETTALISRTSDNANDVIDDMAEEIDTITKAGARISEDMAAVVAGIRRGEGTLGRLVTDDELFERAAAIVENAEAITTDIREAAAQARRMLADMQGDGSAASSIATELRRTLDDARSAIVGLSDNMDAMRHNVLLRGFFNDRGYFSLDGLSPAEYRRDGLLGDTRQPVRVWLRSEMVFAPAENGAGERLTESGRTRLESALGPFLDRLAEGVLVVEGYAQAGAPEERFLASRDRASLAREYLLERFDLRPQATGLMPLSGDSPGSPGGEPWDGLALTLFLEGR
jgi:phospholipid/cholesterol/gamma-HCH transport system substrate-binding protein